MKEQLISSETVKMIKNEKFDKLTQSLLQKWLREEHNIHIGVELIEDGWIVQIFNIEFQKTEADVEFDEYYSGYKTYEEALEKGLQESLKLIKQ